MRKLKIYIETTLFNFYFDEDRGDAHIDTVKLFKEIKAGKYEAFTSDYVVNEIESAPIEKSEKMLNLIKQYGITVLALNTEAEQLAEMYVEQGINKIRLQIYEETKDMSIQERVDRVNKIGEAAAKKYGFKRVASAK
jgi:hypothetical protein